LTLEPLDAYRRHRRVRGAPIRSRLLCHGTFQNVRGHCGMRDWCMDREEHRDCEYLCQSSLVELVEQGYLLEGLGLRGQAIRVLSIHAKPVRQPSYPPYGGNIFKSHSTASPMVTRLLNPLHGLSLAWPLAKIAKGRESYIPPRARCARPPCTHQPPRDEMWRPATIADHHGVQQHGHDGLLPVQSGSGMPHARRGVVVHGWLGCGSLDR
jgi:hypothetical protein